MKNGSYQEAVTSYTKAIEIDPENSIYYSNRYILDNSMYLHTITVFNILNNIFLRNARGEK